MKSKRTEILLNTAKITLAATVAILLSMLLRLNYCFSAGVIAMLSIQPTKKETIKTAMERLLAFACSLVIGYLCFSVLGYEVGAFAIFIFLLVFVCYSFKWNGSITINVVLMSHMLEAGNMEPETVVNEMLIFVIGVSAGIFANMHLKKNVEAIEALKGKTDEQIKKILYGMSEHILDGDASDYNHESFDKLDDYIRDAKNMAEANYGNQIRGADIFDVEYINMRERQCQVLYEMYKLVRHMHAKPFTAKQISDFLAVVSREYHEANKVDKLLSEFHELDISMKSAPLPVERNEFEDRAKLFILLRLLEEFLKIKKEFVNEFY